MTNGKDRLGEIFRRLGDLADKADAALETARKKAHEQSGKARGETHGQQPRVESRVSVRTLDGEQVDAGDMFRTLARGLRGEGRDAEATGPKPSKPLREAVIETVHDTPDEVTAIAELPGVSEDGLDISWEDDVVRLTASGARMDYRAEALLPRSVAGMSFERRLRNGILEMRWHRAGGDGA